MKNNRSSITKSRSQNSKIPKQSNGRASTIDGGDLTDKGFSIYKNTNCLVGAALNLIQLTAVKNPAAGGHALFLLIGYFFLQRNTKNHANARKKPVGKLAFIAAISSIQLSIGSVMQKDAPSGYVLLFVGNVIARLVAGRGGRAEEVYVSGARKISAREAFETHHRILKQKVMEGSHPNQSVNWIGMWLSTKEATTHFLLLGETRSGKSLIMSMLLPILEHRDKRALLFDYASNYYGKLLAMGIERERIVILNPFHRECSEWLLSLDLTNPSKTFNFCTAFFAVGAKKQDAFFMGYAARILSIVMNVLNRAAKDAGQKPIWGFRELIYFVSSRKRFYGLISTYEDTAEELEEMKASSDQVAGVFSTLQNMFEQLKPLGECYYRARLLGHTVSLKDFPDSNKILLLGRDDENGKEPLMALNRAIIDFCVAGIIGKPTSDDTKAAETFIFADEFQNLGKIDKLRVVTTEGGKYAFCAVLATQSQKFVEEVYGEGNLATMLGNITHLAALKVTETQTAEWLSKYFGETTVMAPTTSANETFDHKGIKRITQSVSYTEKTKPLFTPGHFKSQSKIDPQNPQNGLMGVTIRSDEYVYTLAYNFSDLVTMLPPKPTVEQERENIASQDEDVLFFKPLGDEELETLGLFHMVKNPPVEDVENASAEVDFFDLEVTDFEN